MDSGVPNGSRVVTEMGGFSSMFIEIRLVSEKKSNILVEGGSTLVKQGTCFSNSTISSKLGVRGGARAYFLSRLSPIGAGPVETSSCAGHAYFLAGDFAIDTLLGPATSIGDIGVEGVSGTSASMGSFVQDLLSRRGTTVINSKRRLHYLSLKLALRFVVMSSSPSRSWMMQGTTNSTSMSRFALEKFESASKFGTVLAAEADAKEVKANGGTGVGASAFLAAIAIDFFLVGGQTVEVAAGRFPARACLSVPS